MTTEIVKSGAGELSDIVYNPQQVMARATEAAEVLKGVISRKPKPVIINGEQYLEFEDWETIGRFYGLSVRTMDAVPVEVYGVQGAKARAEVINRDGVVVGGAEAYCLRDEERWSTRPVYEWQGEGDDRKRVKIGDEPVPWFQLASMAQTRAASKALSNVLRWVVVLAGYRGTPAEEMTGRELTRSERAPGGPHWCDSHKTHWFKAGKMKSYAHKLPDGTWCNESAESAKEALSPVQTGTPAPPKAALPQTEAVPGIPVGQGEHQAWVLELRTIWKKLEWPTPKIREWFLAQTGKAETKDLSLDELKRVVSLANDELATKKGVK